MMMGGSANEVKLAADGQNGLWVPSSLGLYYFDRRTERFTYRFQHNESNADSLNNNTVLSVHHDRNGVLWVGTENGGLNSLDFRQQQFVRYTHRPGDPNSLSAGRVKAIYQDRDGVLWVGFFPRALNRLDRRRPHHPLPSQHGRGEFARARHHRREHLQRCSGLSLGGQRANGVARLMNALGVSSNTGPTLTIPRAWFRRTFTRYSATERARCGWASKAVSAATIQQRTDSPLTGRFQTIRRAVNAAWVIYQDRSGNVVGRDVERHADPLR